MIDSVLTENTYCRGNYHCMVGIQLNWIGFDQIRKYVSTESKPAKLETSPKGIDPSPYSECSWIYLNLLMHELHKGLVALEL